MDIFDLKEGKSPLIVSIPHAGTHVPEPIASRFTDEGRLLRDTDWHLPLLYDFLQELDVTVIAATHSRFVVDLNRSASGEKLYPGKFETPICPLTSFVGGDVYKSGQTPGDDEIADRIERYWRPYHDMLIGQIECVRQLNGYAVLFDAHSIANEVSTLFKGKLPDFNVGTADGRSCDRHLPHSLTELLEVQSEYSWVLNGRFKGGYITRHYGDPDLGVHAVQLELSQSTYMNQAPPFAFELERADNVRPTLTAFVDRLLAFAP